MSNFFFCENVFKSRLLKGPQKESVCGKGLNMSIIGVLIIRYWITSYK